MRLTTQQRYNLRTALRITGAGLLIALVYPVFADGFGHWLPFLNAALIGLLGGILIAIVELDLFNLRNPQRPFLSKVLSRTLIYTVAFALLVPLVKLLTESLYYGRGLREYFWSSEFQNFLRYEDYGLIVLYALTFIGLIIFTREMNRKLGQGILWNYMIGKYFTPREESGIFMLIDLHDSTKIAEEMSPILYHGLINDFFRDITEPVVRHHGVIYNYVGDQVRITWPLKDAVKNANCILTYYHVKYAFHAMREYYLETYGLIPTFKTAIHCGDVVVGEIGDVKSELVYTGDTIFELALMEQSIPATLPGNPALISDRLLRQVKLPALYKAERLSTIGLDGEEIELYHLIEADPDSV